MEEPELNTLLTSGHVDILAAKVCALPSNKTRQNLQVFQQVPFDHVVSNEIDSFLHDVGSREADEASCMASHSFEEKEDVHESIKAKIFFRNCAQLRRYLKAGLKKEFLQTLENCEGSEPSSESVQESFNTRRRRSFGKNGR
eukprot:CAMPEP_0177595424 /NCGR_PEP_ID=MMETSP0419_2-20121207/10347_1 /TAXON_ID=582737 /ORGANISM="Tetraselmis sp., Strain GSL018" /LENGTH=141 /DNA_ID=CAMNT_0019086879 /DNA_START=336 /DNA_END=761 /DNA_ORIENTATION=+